MKYVAVKTACEKICPYFTSSASISANGDGHTVRRCLADACMAWQEMPAFDQAQAIARAATWMKQEKKIEAVKEVMSTTGVDLKYAKDYVEGNAPFPKAGFCAFIAAVAIKAE